MAEKIIYIRKAKNMFVIKYDTNNEEKAFHRLINYAKDKENSLSMAEALRIIRVLGLAAKNNTRH